MSRSRAKTCPECGTDHPKWSAIMCFRALQAKISSTELTPIGEQYVIPGCEKHERPAGSQLKLWEA